MAHKVTSPLVVVKDAAGKISYFYEGATVPDGFDKDDIARLVEAGMVESIVKESDGEPPVEIPEGDPAEAWTVKQLRAFAEAKGIDLGDSKAKPEILSKLSK